MIRAPVFAAACLLLLVGGCHTQANHPLRASWYLPIHDQATAASMLLAVVNESDRPLTIESLSVNAIGAEQESGWHLKGLREELRPGGLSSFHLICFKHPRDMPEARWSACNVPVSVRIRLTDGSPPLTVPMNGVPSSLPPFWYGCQGGTQVESARKRAADVAQAASALGRDKDPLAVPEPSGPTDAQWCRSSSQPPSKP